MWNAFQRYRALDPEARRYFRKAARLLPWVALSLRLRGFNKTKERLQATFPRFSANNTRRTPAERVQTICRMVNSACRYGVGHQTCLEQSLVLWALLQGEQIPASLRIGVRKAGTKLEAHAWVEHEGMALNQRNDVHRHYTPFAEELSRLPGMEP